MADNTVLNLGSGGDTIVTEQPGGTGAKIPVSKIYTGAADVNGGPVTQTNPLFVELSDGTNALGASAHPVRTDPVGTTTQPVSATSLPLPAGASTAANQATGNTSLASVDSKTPALGQALAAGSVPVVLPAAQITTLTPPTTVATTAADGSNVAIGTTSDASSASTLVGLLKNLKAALAGTLTVAGTVTATVAGATLAAGTALIGAVASALRTDSIMSGTTSLTPKFAKATLSATGEVVALVSSKKIRVLRYSLMADAACSVSFKSHTAGQISGTKYLSANGGAGGTFCPVGHFETTSGEALDLTITGSANVSVDVSYIEV